MSGSYQPVNTFTKRVQPNQIASYIIVICLLIIYLSSVQPNYTNQTTRIIMTIIFLSTFCVLLIFTYITSKIDPVDPVLIQYRHGDRNQLTSILQQCLYCQNCEGYVKSTSRHCKLCNRCIHNFDHHCVWINNCVGQDNYKYFFLMIISAAAYMISFCASVGLLYQQQYSNSFLAAIIVSWIGFGLASIVCIFLLILFGLHCYLIANGLTTFDFIMRRREKAQQQELNQANKQGFPLQDPKMHNQTQQTFGNDQKYGKKPEVNNIIFQNHQEQISSEYQSQKKISSSKFKMETYDKSNSIPHSTNNHEKDLKQFYEQHRSLKLLVGGSILIEQININNIKNYQSNKYLLQQMNKEKRKQDKNYSSLNYYFQQRMKRSQE